MQNNTENQAYAGFFVRLIAYGVDKLIVGIGLLFVRIPFFILGLFLPNNILARDLIFQYSITDMMLYAAGVTYFILLTYHGGATVGKMLMNIQVVSVEDRPLRLLEVIYRETIGRFLSGLVLSIGYLLVIFHKEKRGIHDLLSDTKVVYCFKKKVIVEVPMTMQQIRKPVVVSNYSTGIYAPEVKEEKPQSEVSEELSNEAETEAQVEEPIAEVEVGAAESLLEGNVWEEMLQEEKEEESVLE